MPSGYKADGTPSNATGKGLVHDGSQGVGGMAKKAGHTITKMLIDAMMSGDVPKAKDMCEAIARQAAMGEEWACKFGFDRLIGKQDAIADALREGGASISRIEFVVIDPINAGRNSPEITTTYTAQ